MVLSRKHVMGEARAVCHMYSSLYLWPILMWNMVLIVIVSVSG